MDIKHIARVALGMWWGYLLTDLVHYIGNTPEVAPFTAIDALQVVAFIILIIIIGIATLAAIVKD